jgi:hypothetical protein
MRWPEHVTHIAEMRNISTSWSKITKGDIVVGRKPLNGFKEK